MSALGCFASDILFFYFFRERKQNRTKGRNNTEFPKKGKILLVDKLRIIILEVVVQVTISKHKK